MSSNPNNLMNPTIRLGDQQKSSLLNDPSGSSSLTNNISTANSPQREKMLRRQNLGDKILTYVQSAFWLGVGIFTVYYSNFFHHLFRNPKISPLFFQVSMAGYTMIVLLIFFATVILPVFYGIDNLEEYNPKLIPIGAVVGVVAVVSLIICIWPVWGFTSLLIFVGMWKGFFAMSIFLPKGHLGNLLFLLINSSVVLSFYVIEHNGYFH